ncbi:tail fiber protein [Photorhabdus luminescens]|nr:tail fiber protein [Photorhabdus luminescens]
MNLAKSAVPNSRKINGKALSGDVSLSAGDVGAYTRTEVNNNFARGSIGIVEMTGTYPRILFYPPEDKKNRGYFGIEANLNNDNSQSIYIYQRKVSGENIYVTNFPNKYGTLATIDDINAANNIPVGSPIPWPLPNAPAGYLACNGQAFNKSLYPKLATAYPSGRLPDLRGEFIRGWDDGRGVDPGRVCGSWQADLLASHEHSYRDRYYIENMNSLHRANNKEATPAGYNGNVGSDGTDTDNNSFLYIDSTTSTTGGNETRPRNVAFNYIVKAA